MIHFYPLYIFNSGKHEKPKTLNSIVTIVFVDRIL